MAQAANFRTIRGMHLWTLEEGDYRYIKIRAATRLNRSDRRFYVVIPRIAVYRLSSGNFLKAEWT
ncbi:MAG: hypothetical protein ACYTAN_15960, partial [Planctomycetota bacterium]